MQFNSIDYLVFLLVAVIVYFAIPAKLRQFWLLAASYFFYMNWNAKYALLLLFSTFSTWVFALLIENHRKQQKKYLTLCIVINLALLFYFKYFNFLIGSAMHLFHRSFDPWDIVLPVGISFYTLQALGYSIDVYRGDTEAETNFIRYALFVSFFPQLVAGPIERSGNMLHQIREVPMQSRRDLIRAENIRSGLILLFWGLFLKVVIADRISIFVDEVFSRYTTCGTLVLLLAAVGFLLQLYCDFSSYSIIATGSARIMGFHLMENFHAPLLSHSVSEYWRRWHISLSTWLRDYIYIPLGGNRKGKARKVLNTMITFLVSGFWHGASWTYVCWGIIHGILVSAESLLRKPFRSLTVKTCTRTGSFGFRLLQTLGTFVLLTFSYIFFRSVSIADAFAYIRLIFTQPDFWILNNGGLFEYGLNVQEVFILLFAVLLLLAVDMLLVRKNMSLDVWLSSQWVVFRVLFVLFIVMYTVVYGIYGPGFSSKQFIYFQF